MDPNPLSHEEILDLAFAAEHFGDSAENEAYWRDLARKLRAIAAAGGV